MVLVKNDTNERNEGYSLEKVLTFISSYILTMIYSSIYYNNLC